MGNINQRLNGLNTLAYLGVTAVQPPDFITKRGAPTAIDSKNVYIGNLWLDTTNTPPTAADVWMLVALLDGQATWVNFAGAGAGTVSQFTADAGANPILPDGAGNVNLLGAHGINTDATANTVTFAINNEITLGDLEAIAFGAPALRAATGNVEIDSGNLTLPATTQEDVGVIQINGNNFLHAFGTNNTFGGSLAGNFTLTGTNNVTLGTNTLHNITSASNNVILGENAGTAYVGAESSNILIGSQVLGTAAESHVLRIGAGSGAGVGQLEEAFIAGIHGVTPGGSGILNVTIDSNGQLGTGGSSTGTTSFATDNGTAIPTSGTINVLAQTASLGAGSTVSFSAPGATDVVQLNVTDPNNNTIIGRDSGNLTLTGTFNTAFGEGAGAALTTGSDSVMIGSGAGSGLTDASGCILVGLGAGSAYVSGESNNILVGNQEGIPGEMGMIRIGCTGGSPNTNNTFVGFNAGNNTYTLGTAVSNTAVGAYALDSVSTGAGNLALGLNSLTSLTQGNFNTAISGGENITTGNSNTFCGYQSGAGMISGNNNTFIGQSAGGFIGPTGDFNVMINASGVSAENNTIRIADNVTAGAGLATSCYIGGISGVTTVMNDAVPVLISSQGQLGVTSSSIRYKDNIKNMDSYSELLYMLNPVIFNYKKYAETDVSVGLIAEEVDKVFNALVVYNKEGQPESVKYHDLVPMLLNELQKLSAKVNSLENEFRNML